MGSTVGIAVQKICVDIIKSAIVNCQLDIPDKEITDNNGNVLFVLESVKWGGYDEVTNFYNWLDTNIPPEHYRIIEANHQWPEEEEYNIGLWYDNPFKMCKVVTVELEFVTP